MARVKSMDFFTVGTTGSATSFGDLNLALEGMKGCNNNTYGLMAGGSITGNVKQDAIEYITIASEGDGQEFGDLTNDIIGLGGCSA